MDVRLSGEQQALRDSAVQVVDRFGPRSVRDLDDADRKVKLDAAVEASGWRELRTPTATGGPLASCVEVAIVAEELARGLVDVPFLGPTLAADLRRYSGGSNAGCLETIALSSDLSSIASVVEGGLPTTSVGIDSSGCELALVLDVCEPGQMVVAAEIAEPLRSVDLTRGSATVRMTGTPTGSNGGRPLEDLDLARWTALGLAVSSADLVGTMRGTIDLATDYAKARRQYGVSIGSFQAVQHLLADALVSIEGSRSAVLYAAWAVDALSPDDSLSAAAVAKAYCARAARCVCETAIQVHGGIGNTWDCLAHVYLRRALLSIDILGGIGASLSRVLCAYGIGAPSGLR
jgi:alkylation response protein AidB-like acyl-CoA dehydrogenase